MVKKHQMMNAVIIAVIFHFFSCADPFLAVYRNSVKDVIVF